jgi:ABC-type Na+ efflux pump permease subunit
VGGILVMFAYFIALSPNQQISYSKILPVGALSILTLIILSFSFNLKVTSIDRFIQGNVILYISKNAPILIILALILLLAIIIVVKITNRSTGPLRPFNYV